MTEERFKEAVRKAKESYFKIRSVSCPVFGNETVYFNKYGFDHLLWKGKVKRSIRAQIARIGLIPIAVNILKSSKNIVNYREVKRSATDVNPGFSVAKFWALEGVSNGKSIRVIVRQTNDGFKHFFSVIHLDDREAF